MFGHYLKIAFRNIRKYALQNIVSVLGLALGFVCLSLSIIWIRYEHSFDTFHRDAERIYTVSRYQPNEGREFHAIEILYSKWQKLLELPEIEDYTQFNDFKIANTDATERLADGAFFRFFNIEVENGTDKFKTDPTKIAITRSFAERSFSGRNPIGEMLNEKTVCAVLKDFPGNTSLKFDALSVCGNLDDKGHMTDPHAVNYNPNQFFLVRGGTDMETFFKKAEETIRLSENDYYKLLPITQIHRQTSKKDMYVNYGHIRLFCYAGMVLFICAMVNFILFSLVRLDYRKREMALRLVNGSSGGSLYNMLLVEYGIVLLAAMVAGLVTNILFAPAFSKISTIGLEQMHILTESLKVMFPVFLVAMAVCAASVQSVRRHNMKMSINSNHSSILRRVCIGIQLFISILFIFIVTVMVRQFGLLRKHDWGMRVKDTAVLTIYNPTNSNRYNPATSKRELNAVCILNRYYPPVEELENTVKNNYNELGDEYLKRIDGQHNLTFNLKRLPYITGVYIGFGDGYNMNRLAQQEATQNEKTVQGVSFEGGYDNRFLTLDVLNTDVARFLELTVIDGEIPDRPISDDEVVITENLQKEFKLGPVSSEPTLTVGHKSAAHSVMYIMDENGNLTMQSQNDYESTYTFRVIAVVKDLYTNVFNPAFTPMYALCAKGNRKMMPQDFSISGYYTEPIITLTYEGGMSRRLKSDVAKLMTDAGLDYDLTFSEDRFFESLKSQRHLRNMIMAVGAVCILICLFGIWSMIMLACQERRREIAVRKVHGARKSDILKIFVRDYGRMLAVASALAFASGYIIMHRWLQQFEQRTTISGWIYLLIFAGMALVISLTVLHRVTKAASENPSVVIKNE